MAAELYSTTANTNISNSNSTTTATTVTAVHTKNSSLHLHQPAQSPPPAQVQNLNNNFESTNWQSFYPTLRERNAMMFNNELMADVHFIIGPLEASKRVPAHKYVLAVGSSVFYAMFYGDLAEIKSEIHIPDVEPAAFLILLKNQEGREFRETWRDLHELMLNEMSRTRKTHTP
ncbi:BTB/POZ domain-containing protein 6 isoform X2 [Macrotis lagotis]|uniref:BTB/POZ domain-containing protein 6 isoform X2 n=1 Tax=Macrotis lagotis TaxID=92651 RepID=UPI003D68A91F